MHRPTPTPLPTGLPAPMGTVVAGLLLLCGCASDGARRTMIPFDYESRMKHSVTLGGHTVTYGGPNAIRSAVVTRGQEQKELSAAIEDAFQGMHLSIIKPSLAAGELLPQGRVLETDVIPLSPGEIKRHNAAYEELAVPMDRQFGLGFVMSYRINGKELHLKTSARLYHCSLGSRNWLRFEHGYAGSYFIDQVEERLKKNLTPNAKATP